VTSGDSGRRGGSRGSDSFISHRRGGLDARLTTVLVVAAGVLVVLLVPASIVTGMVSDSCGSGLCDFGLMEFAGWFGLLGIPAAFMVSLVLTLWVRRRGRKTWWTGLVAVGSVIGSFMLAVALLYAGAGIPLFR